MARECADLLDTDSITLLTGRPLGAEGKGAFMTPPPAERPQFWSSAEAKGWRLCRLPFPQ